MTVDQIVFKILFPGKTQNLIGKFRDKAGQFRFGQRVFRTGSDMSNSVPKT